MWTPVRNAEDANNPVEWVQVPLDLLLEVQGLGFGIYSLGFGLEYIAVLCDTCVTEV